MIKFITQWWRARHHTFYNQSNWRRADGSVVKVVDMSDHELRATIFYIHRRTTQMVNERYHYALRLWQEEPDVYQYPGPHRNTTEYDVRQQFPIYADVLMEADRRKLTWSAR